MQKPLGPVLAILGLMFAIALVIPQSPRTPQDRSPLVSISVDSKSIIVTPKVAGRYELFGNNNEKREFCMDGKCTTSEKTQCLGVQGDFTQMDMSWHNPASHYFKLDSLCKIKEIELRYFRDEPDPELGPPLPEFDELTINL